MLSKSNSLRLIRKCPNAGVRITKFYLTHKRKTLWLEIPRNAEFLLLPSRKDFED